MHKLNFIFAGLLMLLLAQNATASFLFSTASRYDYDDGKLYFQKIAPACTIVSAKVYSTFATNYILQINNTTSGQMYQRVFTGSGCLGSQPLPPIESCGAISTTFTLSKNGTDLFSKEVVAPAGEAKFPANAVTTRVVAAGAEVTTYPIIGQPDHGYVLSLADANELLKGAGRFGTLDVFSINPTFGTGGNATGVTVNSNHQKGVQATILVECQ